MTDGCETEQAPIKYTLSATIARCARYAGERQRDLQTRVEDLVNADLIKEGWHGHHVQIHLSRSDRSLGCQSLARVDGRPYDLKLCSAAYRLVNKHLIETLRKDRLALKST